MNRFRRFCGLALGVGIFLGLGLLFPPKSEAALGEGLKIAEGQPVNIKAETLEYLAEQNLLVAEGEVEITYQTTRLTADRVEFNQITGNAVAIGNVFYEEAGETVVADQAEFNFDTDRGIMQMGELSLQDDHYITGQQLEKTGKETYDIRKGSYSACSGPWPAWKFRCSSATIHNGQYLQAWNTVGYLKGIPVFYFPYFIFPIKTERQSGFLVPEVGFSDIKGFTIGNAFFWAISDSQDATLRHTFYEDRGHKLDLEYRYKYSQDTDGTFLGQYIRDRLDFTQKERLEWHHRQGLPYGIKALANLNLTSDKQFDQDFTNVLDSRTNQLLKSDASFTKNFSQHTLRLLIDRLDDLRAESSSRRDQRLPQLDIISQQQQIFGTNLYIQQQTQIAHVKREGNAAEKLDFSRIDVQPTLSMPINVFGQAVTINPSVQLRETYYTRNITTAADPDLTAQATHREYYTASVGISGPRFNRIFDFGTDGRTQKLKHLIEPTLSLNYAPGIDETDLPKFDGVDRVGSEQRSRNMSYGITQRLLLKRVAPNEWTQYLKDLADEKDVAVEQLPTEVKELVSLAVNQSYNFEVDKYNFSDITATLQATPFENYNLSLNATYDLYAKAVISTSVDFRGALWNFLNFNTTWRRQASVNRETGETTSTSQFLDVTTGMNFWGVVGLTYRTRFNVETKDRLEDNVGLTYNAQCWSLLGNFTQQLVSGEHDRGFNIILQLKHLGRLFEYGG